MKGGDIITISSIIAKGKGKAGPWEVVEHSDNLHTLYHHGTRMLEWREYAHYNEMEWAGLGWGSVSDQNGMNIAFRVLGLPYYFQRAGGAEVIKLPRNC